MTNTVYRFTLKHTTHCHSAVTDIYCNIKELQFAIYNTVVAHYSIILRYDMTGIKPSYQPVVSRETFHLQHWGLNSGSSTVASLC